MTQNSHLRCGAKLHKQNKMQKNKLSNSDHNNSKHNSTRKITITLSIYKTTHIGNNSRATLCCFKPEEEYQSRRLPLLI